MPGGVIRSAIVIGAAGVGGAGGLTTLTGAAAEAGERGGVGGVAACTALAARRIRWKSAQVSRGLGGLFYQRGRVCCLWTDDA
jgi:hypothetical protein